MENIFNITADIQLVEDSEAKENEAVASLIANNPNLSFAKFIFTDDKPNLNKQRIPKEEFANIIRTGVFMPIKKHQEEIKDGHDDATPLGVISHLKIEENQVIGLAALWNAERQDDIQALKDMIKDNRRPQLSWEVWYADSAANEDGVQDLHGVTVRATTIVGLPAYAGRTPIFAIASEKNSEENKVEELQAKIAALEKELSELKATLSEKESALSAQTSELNSLKEFKTEIERKEAESAKISSIKEKFSAANIEKEDKYFEDNRETLLKLDETALDFMIQEMVAAFASKGKSAESSKTKIPQLPEETEISNNPKELAKALKENLAAK